MKEPRPQPHKRTLLPFAQRSEINRRNAAAKYGGEFPQPERMHTIKIAESVFLPLNTRRAGRSWNDFLADLADIKRR